MSLEENKAIIRSLFEAENKKDLAVLDNLLAPDFVDHCHQLRSLESYKQFLTMIFNVFPDYHITIEDIIAEGDKVWFVLHIREHTKAIIGVLLQRARS